jgi:hypothetical protein
MMRLLPVTPATARERIDVGALGKLVQRWASANPGNSFSRTARVASGVTSRAIGPVPPVVRIREIPSLIHCRRVELIFSFSSGTMAEDQAIGSFQSGLKTFSSSGPPRS